MPKMKNNVGWFSKQAEAVLTKKLEQQAKQLNIDLANEVEPTFLETYKSNVLLSYEPRSARGKEVAEYNKRKNQEEIEKGYKEKGYRLSRKKLTYHHTGLFLDSIDTVRETDKLGRIVIRIIIKDLKYPDPSDVKTKDVSTVDVYKYLTEGTSGGGYYPSGRNGDKIIYSYNFPTPKHEFEAFTNEQMKGYLEMLKNNMINYKRR